jgi:EamA-like transporter family
MTRTGILLAVISWQGRSSFRWGAMLVVGACLCWGIDNNVTRKFSSADPVQIAMLKGLVAAAVNLLLACASVAVSLPANILLTVFAVGFLGYGVSLALFVLGLRHLGAARTSVYCSLAPFVGAVLAVVMLDEPLSVELLLVGGLMALGLWLHLAEQREHEHVQEAMQHEHRHAHDEHHRHGHGPEDPPSEPQTHLHRHPPLVHRHAHYPDLRYRRGHRLAHRPSVTFDAAVALLGAAYPRSSKTIRTIRSTVPSPPPTYGPP